MTDELFYKIAITKIPKIGPILSKNLISYCGGAAAVYQTKKSNLMKVPGIGAGMAEEIMKGREISLQLAEKECAYLEKNKVKALFYLDSDYPRRLKHFHNCPVVLYYKGNADLNHDRIIAIVGTRQPSLYGKLNCEEIVAGLEKYNALVISGLAYGIDITAHKKCVDIGLPTIGVMGHGMSMIYPAAHSSVAGKMVQNGGLLTEFTHDMTPEREFFPMRNRIIAGICDALVVVETAAKGGSMISAHMANDYGKDVFAIPGRLNDKMSEGCNHLIKTHKAALLEGVEDIGYIMRWDKQVENTGFQKSLFVELNEKEQQIVDLLKNGEDLSVDKLCYETSINSGEMASLLLDLEFKGIIKHKPGKRFVLI
ncbi:MAG: DNA processing protein [Saprospiraceae bacterium]|jgi:DNA processing protein